MRQQSHAPDLNYSSIEVHIEELVLHGFEASDRHRIGEAVRRELARLLDGHQLPKALATSGQIDRVIGGTIRLDSASRPATTGEQVANAILGGLKE